MNLSSQEFVAKWRNNSLKERSAAQEHFIDLCRLVGHPTPAEMDGTGERFTFEAGASKQRGGQGWADVWKRGHFAWEYKGKHADLDKAYQQLLQYREALENPPLLVVSDLDRIEIHTNFTNTVKRRVVLTLDQLLTVEGIKQLRAVFETPEEFRAEQTTEAVTRQAAQDFAKLADLLRNQGHEPQRIAHFLIRLLFCLFAEDIELLPRALFTRLVDRGRLAPDSFNRQLRQLFEAMAVGDFFGEHKIRHFDGGLFDSADVLPLDRAGLEILYGVSSLDWSSIEPSILGTLFERSLDPSKRSQLGAHYTSRDDILLIVEPVLMAPLRRKWATVKAEAVTLASRRDELIGEWQARTDRTQAAKSAQIQSIRTQYGHQILGALQTFIDEIAAIRVLDPACGSANFLYVSLRLLLDLQKEVITLAAELSGGYFFPTVSPVQLFGIEINSYAHELAQATIWIGWIQWLHENGYGTPSEPILKLLDNIKNMDAVLAFDADGKPYEPEWPAADVIVGNPPFLGSKLMRAELGDAYVEYLHALYSRRMPKEADLVCYWFERTREMLQRCTEIRSGLLSTNSIRGGANRKVLERIKETGDIFMAWSDRPWFLDGAAVRVSIVGFDAGAEEGRTLDGIVVNNINPDLTSGVDITVATGLEENHGIAFMGDTKQGPFDIDSVTAEQMLTQKGNPNGKPNSDVVVPWRNGLDITRRPRNMWIVDFGTDMSERDAAQYEAPFEFVKNTVKPERDKKQRSWNRSEWWLHYAPRPAMRTALETLSRYIVTPTVARHRLFVWLSKPTLPDHQLIVFAREDDYFFGALHSMHHELWSLRKGTSLGVGNDPRYTPTTTFETFPFPWPPGMEPTDDPRVQAIAQAAKELVEKRDNWLNPPGLSESELKKKTLTNLYNAMPTWLKMAHEKLDKAVFDAYGWPHDLSDEEVLARLLALNLERAAGERLL